MNDIGAVDLQLAQPLMFAPYSDNKSLGAFILIDTQTNNTAGVGFIL
jgi:sulfate adenylyltransferase subunit 1